MKKAVCTILVFVLIFTMVQTEGVTVSAQTGDYIYSTSTGTATITGYIGAGGDITLPDTLGGYPVTGIGFAAFKDAKGITSIAIGKSITTMSDYAFYLSTGLPEINVDPENAYFSSVDGVLFDKTKRELIKYPATKSGSYTMPNSVNICNESAFTGCTLLTSIILSDNLYGLGCVLFNDCPNLTQIIANQNSMVYSSVDGVLLNKAKTAVIECPEGKTGSFIIPNSVTSIATEAFTNSTKLTNVTIPTGVTEIGLNAFEGCTGLTSINIPNTVTTIREKAFEGCTSLVSVQLSNTLTLIDNELFKGCSSLASITIPSSVTDMGSYAFQDCANLANVTILNGIQTIYGIGLFSGCNSLKSLYIPESLTNLSGIQADFVDFGPMEFVVDPANTAYVSKDGLLYSKDMSFIVKYPGNRKGSFTIPENVAINPCGFIFCKGLTSITLNSLFNEYIEASWFRGCEELTQINVSPENQNITSVDGVVFNKAQTELVCFPSGKAGAYSIPTGVTTIRLGAFIACTVVTNVTIPSSVTKIGELAFYECTSLSKIDIPNSVTDLGGKALYGCTSLVSAKIGNGVTKIGSEFFSGCTELSSVSLGSSITSISNLAFRDCVKLTRLCFYGKAPSIGTNVFYNCSPNLKIYYLTGGGFYSPWHGIPTAVFTPLIVAPASLTMISKTVTSVSLSWTGVQGATSYNIYNGTTKLVGTQNNVTNYTVTGLTPSTEYNFRIEAVNAATESPLSDLLTVTTDAPLPLSVPTGFITTGKTDSTIDLSWSPVEGATSYEVYIMETSLSSEPIITTSYTVTSLCPNTTYIFTVKAVNEFTKSSSSAELIVTTELKHGDINDDGDVNLKDITTLSRYIAGWPELQVQEQVLDVNVDGSVNLMDVTLLSRYVAGWNVTIQ